MGNNMVCGNRNGSNRSAQYMNVQCERSNCFSTPGNGRISRQVCFGAGCYWGTEKYFKYKFSEKFPNSIASGTVGFMGPPGAVENPTYKIISKESGYVQVYFLEYNGDEDMFENLVRFFFQFHDPTTLDCQGNDQGTQYASVIYCYDDIQIQIAKKVKRELQTLLDTGIISDIYVQDVVETVITKNNAFYPAPAVHQDYLRRHPKGYCNHKIRFSSWPTSSDNQSNINIQPEYLM
eukprot:gene11546-24157_t